MDVSIPELLSDTAIAAGVLARHGGHGRWRRRACRPRHGRRRGGPGGISSSSCCCSDSRCASSMSRCSAARSYRCITIWWIPRSALHVALLGFRLTRVHADGRALQMAQRAAGSVRLAAAQSVCAEPPGNRMTIPVFADCITATRQSATRNGRGAPPAFLREISMKKLITLSLALGVGLAFAGSATAQVRFGVGGPMTGGSAAFGAQLRHGAEQAVADINAAGGILGKKISCPSATTSPIRRKACRSPTSSSATA